MFSNMNGAHWPHSGAIHDSRSGLLGGDANRYKRRCFWQLAVKEQHGEATDLFNH
jgi:hypothetical protein